MTTCPLDTPTAGCCHWCGKKLRGRQTRWCGRRCAREATANHRWTQAKAAAKAAARYYLCDECGMFYGDDEIHVDHIVPCKGKHGTWGCHHHQDNLRVLCIPCHKIKTASDRKKGRT